MDTSQQSVQRSLIDNRSGQQRVAVALKCDSKSAKPVLPLMIEVALQLDFVDRWLIRFGIRVDGVWHNSLLPVWPISKEEHGPAMVLPLRHESVVRSVVLGGYARPSSRARATASVRRWTWSLPKILRLWPFTVSRARNSRAPIS